MLRGPGGYVSLQRVSSSPQIQCHPLFNRNKERANKRGREGYRRVSMYAGIRETGVPRTKGHTTVSLLSLIPPGPGLSMSHRTLMQISAISFFI